MIARSNNFMLDAELDAAHESQALRAPSLAAARLADHDDLATELHLCAHSESATPDFQYRVGRKEDEDARLPRTL
ncbi:hypothetical protein [Bradyrhizobium icense]|uniref:hypothetical protein n=1 Tax=Bradyrhizobium icense TaxID=1274631 RepID=UPI0012EA903A|nr:hypothetical protein [Bradyrhizobium icense]